MKTIKDYADLVKEKHALNTTIAPVETDLTSASKTYVVGQKFIHDGVLYQAKTPIAQGAALVLNTNYETADDVSSEIQTLTNNLSDEVETRAELGAHQLLEIINGNPTVVTATIDKNGITFSSYTPPYNLEWYISPTRILKAGTYTISNKQTGVSLPLYVKNNTTNTSIGTVNPNESLTFTLSADSLVSFNYWMETGNTFTGNIKPLLKLASDPSDEFMLYAMTNRELTEDATYKKGDTIAISSNPLYLSALFQDSKHLRLTIPINKPISASGATVTINSVQVFNNGNYEEISSGITATAYKVDGIGLYVVIENAIDFTTFAAFANATIRFSNASIAFT